MNKSIVMAVLSVAILGVSVGCATKPRQLTVLTVGPGSANSLQYRTVHLKVTNCTGVDTGTIKKVPVELYLERTKRVAWIIHGRTLGDGISWKIIDDNNGTKDWFNSGNDMVVSGRVGRTVNDAYYTEKPTVAIACPENAIGDHPCDWKYRVEVWKQPEEGPEFRCASVDPKIRIRD